MRSTHIVIGVAAWLGIGLAVVKLADVPESTLAWWLWLGLPGLLAVGGLAFIFATVVVLLVMSFAYPPHR